MCVNVAARACVYMYVCKSVWVCVFSFHLVSLRPFLPQILLCLHGYEPRHAVASSCFLVFPTVAHTLLGLQTNITITTLTFPHLKVKKMLEAEKKTNTQTI